MPKAPALERSKLGPVSTPPHTRTTFIHDADSNTRVAMAKVNATFGVPMQYVIDINRTLQHWRFMSLQTDEKTLVAKCHEEGDTASYAATMVGNSRVNAWQGRK